MSFGITGASCSGKTTLAKGVAQAMNIHYHDASVTRLMKEAGVDPVGPTMPIEVRLEAQEHLLKAYIKEIKAIPGVFITDRTPIDMIAYTLGEITMNNCTEEQGRRVFDYMFRCLAATAQLFDTILVLRPFPNYESSPTRPSVNTAYQWETQLLMEGALANTDICYGTMNTMDISKRLENATEFFGSRIKEWEEMKSDIVMH
jgi:hypothetical protein